MGDQRAASCGNGEFVRATIYETRTYRLFQSIKHLLVEPQSLLQNGWSKWLHAEELKR